jgi:hypothetical protein
MGAHDVSSVDEAHEIDKREHGDDVPVQFPLQAERKASVCIQQRIPTQSSP